MKATKIDWCDCTINPVIGCAHNCEYCYARKINARFGWVSDFTSPQFFPARLAQLYAKRPQSIFMDSMSDITFWQPDWKRRTFEAIRENPQHDYIFLTKNPTVYNKDYKCGQKNVFLGVSLTGRNTIREIPPVVDFLSIEPILTAVDIPVIKNIKQIIIGAQTGNAKNRIVPDRDWIDALVAQADASGRRVFMKESLRGIMGGDFRQDPLIWINGGVRA